MYILRPHAAGILYAPPRFYTPPTPRRVVQGQAGGVYKIWPPNFGNRPNLGLESTVSNPELTEIFVAHQVPGRELSEFLLVGFYPAICVAPSSLSSLPKQYSRNSTPLVSYTLKTLSSRIKETKAILLNL